MGPAAERLARAAPAQRVRPGVRGPVVEECRPSSAAVVRQRVIERPSVKNAHTSSRLASPSTTPTARALRSFAQVRNVVARSPPTLRGIRDRVTSRQSQSSVETTSRALRALSRATATALAMEAASWRSSASASSVTAGSASRSTVAPDHPRSAARPPGPAAGRRLPPDDVDVEQPGDDVGVLDGGAEAVDAPGEMAQHVRTRMRRTY